MAVAVHPNRRAVLSSALFAGRHNLNMRGSALVFGLPFDRFIGDALNVLLNSNTQQDEITACVINVNTYIYLRR